MGEYEPNDSRNVTRSSATAPGEPPRTGPREGTTRGHGEHGEQGVRAAPHAGTDQSQGMQGQSQSMGGMSQSQGGFGTGSTPSAQQDTGERTGGQQPVSSPAQRDGGGGSSRGFGTSSGSPTSGGSNSGGFGTSPASPTSGGGTQAGYGSPGGPQEMQQPGSDDERTRREQAAGQGEPAPQGTGYNPSGDDSELDEDERGYGGGGEERIKRIEKDS